ncbi:hypothetical protein FRC11_006111 [Ceratobasidium sp. 423]|nr:hypothetical protein FRC11_006111 [Ceratobasidium sp. 423]
MKASQGTCIDSKLVDFKFLYQPRVQSPLICNLHDSDREIVLVPSFVSDKVLMIKTSLDLKAVSLSKTMNSKSKSLVYVKVNEPVTKLNGNQWPEWGISKAWKEAHLQEYNKYFTLINPERTIMPNVTEFTKCYKAQPRQFLESMPPQAELLEDDR